MSKKIIFILILILFLGTFLRWNSYEGITSADPYYHYRKASEILSGDISDVDYLRNPPEGLLYQKNFYHYLIAYSSKLFPFATLEEYMGVVPVLLSIISIIIAFYIGEMLRKKCGLFTAFFIATVPIIVERTERSFADTDAIILCFILMLIFLSLKFLMTERVVYLSLLGFTIFLFQTTWTGFWYYSYFLLGFFLLYSVYLCVSKKDVYKLKYFAISSTTYIIPAMLYDRQTLSVISRFYTYHIRADIVKATELAPITKETSWNKLGIALPLGILGCILLIYLIYRGRKCYAHHFLLLSFFVLSVVTLIGGYRFLFLFAIPLTIFASFFCVMAFEKIWKLKRKISVVFLVLFFCFLTYHVSINKKWLRGQPSGDLEECLNWINENTPEDSIILAWWDYGYWIETIAERPSFVDNGYRPLRKVNWIAETLISEDTEKLNEFDADYILLTKRELYDFGMISRQIGQKIRLVTKSGFVMVNEKEKSMLFTKLYLDNAKDVENVELIKDFGTVKLFKVIS